MLEEGYICMSQKEVDRLGVIQATANRQLKQSQAAKQLGISVRQVKRLVRRYRKDGVVGLISGHRNQRSNNRIPTDIRQQTLNLLRQHYPDFGPTFAHEKLTLHHAFPYSVETLRQWMIAESVWCPKSGKTKRPFPLRERRPCFGELIQIDGSPHDWFEGRLPSCTLIVFIDDATSRLLYLRFVPAETTQAYMEGLKYYLLEYGRPAALYFDRHSIFRVNIQDAVSGTGLTQFGRALKTLDIDAIYAQTPQAKGRVERANKTLQDRLVKEMRLLDINCINRANAFLADFMADYNQRFAVAPKAPLDAHRSVLHSQQEVEQILSLHYTRTVSKNVSMQFKQRVYQIQVHGQGYGLRGQKITVCEAFDGHVTLLHKGKSLDYRVWQKGLSFSEPVDGKALNHVIDRTLHQQAVKKNYRPAVDHPWRKTPVNPPVHTLPKLKA